jgi:excisionase family DNA binding protein
MLAKQRRYSHEDRMTNRLLNPYETAAKLGCTRRHLENLMKRGDAPPSVRLGRLRRFPERAVDEWICSKIAPPENPSLKENGPA